MVATKAGRTKTDAFHFGCDIGKVGARHATGLAAWIAGRSLDARRQLALICGPTGDKMRGRLTGERDGGRES
jgi:hypothetical protein